MIIMKLRKLNCPRNSICSIRYGGQKQLNLSSKGIDLFIEAGPGKVLTGLNKRINKEASHVSVSNQEAIDEILLKIKELS